MTTTEYTVTGMTCGHCVAHVTEEVQAVPGVADVRGAGLLLAAELSTEGLAGRTAGEVARACLDAGLVVNGVTATALRFAPPLTVSDDEIDEAVAIVASVLGGAA